MNNCKILLLALSVCMSACGGGNDAPFVPSSPAPASAPSAEEIQSIFEQEVALASTCSADSECVVINPGCPLGCGTAINVNEKENIEAYASELIIQYESGGENCAYGCVAQYAVCNMNKCETRDYL